MKCSGQCIDTATDKRGQTRETGTKTWDLGRECCARTYLESISPKGRKPALRVIANINPDLARRLRGEAMAPVGTDEGRPEAEVGKRVSVR